MAGKRQKHEEHEEHVNHERWLVTYADMITLLMVLFIVLFAMGQTDLAKYKKLKTSLATGFGGADKMALLDGGDGINSGGASPAGVVPSEIAAKAALTTLEKRSTAWNTEKAKLQGAATALEESLEAAKSAHLIDDSQIKVAVDSRGLVITISSDVVLFAPGSATLQGGGQRILDRLASQLASLPNQINVEGFTDNVPISGRYPSNWELSTARAVSVLRSFIERHALPSSRGSATGFADQRPIASNDTAEGRAKNRRVEIVVVASVADPHVDSPDAVAAAEASHEPESTDETESSDTESSDTGSHDTEAHDTETPMPENGAVGAEAPVANVEAPATETTVDPSAPTTTEDLHFDPIPEITLPKSTSPRRPSSERSPVTFTPNPLTASTTNPKPTVPKPTGPTTVPRTQSDTTTEKELIISPPVKPIA